MIDCDCFIGTFSSEDIYKSTIEYHVLETEQLQPYYKEVGILKGEPQTAKQLVDGRKGYLFRHNYCPFCGIKVNWKEILKFTK